ncbi:MAG: hypothetical protein QOD80_270 [Verrucomicrobiota bacterium]|jgi:hypothetical protein
MNIAFPALFVFLLALPGIILRYAYRDWAWKIPVYRLPLGEEIAKSVVSSAILHLFACWVADTFGYRVNFRDVVTLMTGGFGLPAETLKLRLEAITARPVAVMFYFLSLYAAAAGLGLIAHIIVRRCRLDHRFKPLRFDNFWHYALNAEIPLFEENISEYAAMLDITERDLVRQESLTIVSCVVAHGATSFVYFGFPVDYSFDRSGGLEKIVIENVSFQELLTPDEEIATRAAGGTMSRASIEADLLILNSADIHNLAVQYIFGVQITSGSLASPFSSPEATESAIASKQ